MFIIMGLFVFLTATGCATSRPRVMQSSDAHSAPVSGSPHPSGPQTAFMRGGIDCFDILIMIILFTWLFD